MGLAPFGALGGGAFKTAAQRASQQQDGRKIQADATQIKVSDALEAVAKRKGTELTSIALAYVMHKTPYVFPIVGGRKIEHLRGNIAALTVRLSQEDMAEIEAAVPFDIGFPMTFFYKGQGPRHVNDVWLLNMAGTFDYVKEPGVITPPEA